MPDLATPVPSGYTSRALSADDADLAAALCVDCEQHDYGEPRTDASDLRALFATADFDLAEASWLISEGERHVALAVPNRRGGAHVCVHPDHRARGLETHLVRLMVATARSWGIPELHIEVPPGSAFDSALAAEGFVAEYECWSLAAQPSDIASTTLPDGYTTHRCAELTGDDLDTVYAAMHELIEVSFAHWPGRVYRDYPTWRATFVDHDGANPENWWFVTDATRQVVGSAVVLDYTDSLWINSLAVAAEHRGKGIGGALIHGVAQSATALGRPEVGLDTDSRTGAKDLYLRVGMNVTATDSTWVRRFSHQ